MLYTWYPCCIYKWSILRAVVLGLHCNILVAWGGMGALCEQGTEVLYVRAEYFNRDLGTAGHSCAMSNAGCTSGRAVSYSIIMA